jgi:undecaprenyl-phosphate 4-deoxy-4-formamido-L-arabinose transferase
MEQNDPEISVVIPVFNEEPNLRELFRRTTETLDALDRSFEVVIVDDGSTDGSLQALKEIRAGDSRLRIVCLARNFGQSPALYAGFAHVRGKIIAMLDADLQNPPEELPKVIAKIDEGYDFASGYRQRRQDTFLRTIPSRLINYVVKKATRTEFRDVGCSIKAFRREVTDRLIQFTHRSRYVAVDVAWLGVRAAEVEVGHGARVAGKSKYGLFKLFRTGFDLVTSVTAAPLQFFGFVGWLFALVGFGMGIRLAYFRYAYGEFNQYISVIAIFFFLFGMQMAATGLMCEYISRIYIEVQNRPYFVVKEVID